MDPKELIEQPNDEGNPLPKSVDASPKKDDTNPTVNDEVGEKEPPPKGYAKEGNFDGPRSFETGEHDPSPAPVEGFDPAYGNNPYKGGFHRDRQGNERDHLGVTVKGEIDPKNP